MVKNIALAHAVGEELNILSVVGRCLLENIYIKNMKSSR